MNLVKFTYEGKGYDCSLLKSKVQSTTSVIFWFWGSNSLAFIKRLKMSINRRFITIFFKPVTLWEVSKFVVVI